MLAWLPDEEIDVLLPRDAVALNNSPKLTIEKIRENIRQARERGYVLVLDQIVDRMGAVGVPVLGFDGRPIAALSIASLSERIAGRAAELAVVLQQEAAHIADPRVPAPRTEGNA